MTARELAEIAVRTCQWTHIFQVQVKRFLEDFDRKEDGAFPWEGDDEISLFVGDRIFMISAIQHVINGLDYMNSELCSRNESTEQIEEILNHIADEETRNNIKLLRNMNEHDIEYMAENGRKQAQFVRKIKKNGINYSINAHCTFMDGKNKVFLIGNVDVIALAKEIKKQSRNIDKLCSELFFKYYWFNEENS